MLMEKYLSDELYTSFGGVKALCGFTIDDLIRSGKANTDSSMGIYAGDADCYIKFAKLFNPIIKDYHQISLEYTQPEDLSLLQDIEFPNPDPQNKYIISTRIRVGRNIANLAFPSAISADDRKKIELIAVKSFDNLEGNLSGQYFPLHFMSQSKKDELVNKHLLFKQGDRFLDVAGCNRDWPESRGIYISDDRKFVVWVNEEDSLRIISIQDGADIASVFNRLMVAIKTMGDHIDFAKDKKLGYLSSCPSNLGTSMRASVHMRLPKLSLQADFKDICKSMGLSVRGTHGEHTESEGGVYDISNTARLGLSETDCAKVLYNGVLKLIEMEKEEDC